jgi:uncharacterized membrane protein YfcA
MPVHRIEMNGRPEVATMPDDPYNLNFRSQLRQKGVEHMASLAQNPAALIAFGVFVGVFSGLMGLGGGAVMIPIMVLMLGIEQTKAHGLSLAVMIPPVTLPAVIRYYQEGTLVKSDLIMALIIAVGFASGSYFGGWTANLIGKPNQDHLKLVFGFILTYVAAYTVFSAVNKTMVGRNALLAMVVLGCCLALFGVTKWYSMAQR